MKSNNTENQNANKDLVVHIGPRIECSDVSVIRNKQEIICCHIIEEVLYIFYYINVLFLYVMYIFLEIPKHFNEL